MAQRKRNHLDFNKRFLPVYSQPSSSHLTKIWAGINIIVIILKFELGFYFDITKPYTHLYPNSGEVRYPANIHSDNLDNNLCYARRHVVNRMKEKERREQKA